MRITLTRVLTVFLIIILVLIFWSVISQNSDKKKIKVCQHSDAFMKQLHDLTDRVHHVLSTLSLTHFLCYGSLWGQIRLSRSLPWESTSQFCLRNEELVPLDEVYIIRAFDKHGLKIQYNSADGIYLVIDPYLNGVAVELYVFEEDKLIHMYRRIGWKRRVLPPDCESMKSLECFPPRLIHPPLPVKEFGGYILPVPREGIELQKYHYEDTWWKEIKPRNC